MLQDFLAVIFISFTASLCSEGISWYLVYRTRAYKVISDEITLLKKKVEKMADRKSAAIKGTKDKKYEKLDDQLKKALRTQVQLQFRSLLVIAIFMIVVFTIMNRSFSGVVVAKLPFTPFRLITGLTHRNLLGEDFQECSAVFVYVLSSVVFKQTVQRYFGFAPRNTPSIFDSMPEPPSL